MKKLSAAPLIVCAVCFLFVAGCKAVTEKELYYDATENPDRVAASGYPDVFTVECSVIFKTAFLRPYVGWDIVAIKLFNPVNNETISYTPVIYQADSLASSPGDPVSRNATPAAIAADTWQTITLDTPVTIEASRDYWAGYSAVTIPDVCLLAQGSSLNRGNSRIAFYGSSDFQKAHSNWLVRILVKDNRK